MVVIGKPESGGPVLADLSRVVARHVLAGGDVAAEAAARCRPASAPVKRRPAAVSFKDPEPSPSAAAPRTGYTGPVVSEAFVVVDEHGRPLTLPTGARAAEPDWLRKRAEAASSSDALAASRPRPSSAKRVNAVYRQTATPASTARAAHGWDADSAARAKSGPRDGYGHHRVKTHLSEWLNADARERLAAEQAKAFVKK
mmetsp:Transcript_28063/g.91741  ORF Transcript_28063/g.91741 Transcript_28063/m.91741 type:complete len:199 (-) Transcript_28063:83-679(-)